VSLLWKCPLKEVWLDTDLNHRGIPQNLVVFLCNVYGLSVFCAIYVCMSGLP
jgi:hypothetical protein